MHESTVQWRLSARELAFVLLFWMSLATLSAANRLFDPRGFGFGLTPTGPIAMAYVESLVWAALTPAIFWLAARASVSRSSWWIRIPLLVAAGIVVSIVVYVVLTLARTEVFEIPRRRVPFMLAPMRELGRFRFLNQLITYGAVLAAGFAREYFMRDQIRARQAAKLEAQLADARLDALRMQLHPHFLFNTLHAISALVERDPSGVRRMIARLSELLRHTIDLDRPSEVPLRDEVGFLRRYIELMEVRFQGRLRVELDIDESTLDALVPDLILQPVVENALEHGANRAVGEALVTITAHAADGRLVLRVRDNGPGLEAQSLTAGGVGIANIRARLAQLYGDAASFTLSNAEGGGTLAEIVMPLRGAEV